MVSRLYTGRSGLLHVPLLIAALIPVILLLALATSCGISSGFSGWS